MLLAFLAVSSRAQRSQMFGPFIEREMTGIPLGFFSVPPGGPQREFGILTTEPRALSFMKLVNGDSLAIVRQVRIAGSARSASFLEGNPARVALYALLSGEGDTVRLIRVARKAVEAHDVPLSGKADGILCADIDSDGQREVIAYGRKVAGLSVLQHGSGVMLNPRDPLFLEISAADATVVDVDGDGVNDVLLLDWLNDRLLFYQGIGRGSFSEPSGVDLPGEPGTFSVVSRGEHLWVGVSIPASKQIVVLVRDTTDRLVLQGSCAAPWEPEDVAIRDVNGDGRPDLACTGSGEIAVMLSSGEGTYRTPVHFEAPGGAALWCLEDIDNDRLPDLLLADAGRRVVGAAIHTVPARFRSATTYLVGKQATDLLITEATGDRRNDLVVTSAGALALFSQINGKMFDPTASVEIPGGAKRTVSVSGNVHPRFLVSYPHTEELAAVALHGEPPLVRFPAGADPGVLMTGTDEATGVSWILSRYRPGARKEYAVAIYEQLNERQYLERRLGGGVTARASAVAACPALEGIPPTLLVVTHDAREKTVVVMAYTLGPTGNPAGEHLVASLRDTIGRFAWIKASDLDRDGQLDLLIGLQRPTQRVAVLYGQGRTATSGDLVFMNGPGVPDESWLEARDLDGDGNCDLLLCGDGRRSIEVVYGTGPRAFRTARTVISKGDVAAFAAGPLISACDLVVANPRGSMTVFHSPFQRDR